MRLHLPHALPRVRVPHPDHLVAPCRRDIPPVLRKLTAGQTLSVTQKLANGLAAVDVPHLDAEVARARHDRVTPQLHRVDGTRVAPQLFQKGARLAVPHADGDVLGAGHDVLVVEGQVEDGRGVGLEAPNGSISRPNTVDDNGGIRRPGYKDVIVVLKTQDGRFVVGRERYCNGHGWVHTLVVGKRGEMKRLAVGVEENRGLVDDFRWTYDETALKRVHVPDANRLVSRASDDFIPILC